MKLQLKSLDFKKISKNYSLGEIKSVKLINGGAVNYNYHISTDKGDFIIRVLGENFNERKKKRMKLVFKTLEYLNNNYFPYKIPNPIKNKANQYLSNISGNNLWVYERLDGKTNKKINLSQTKEIARAIATYHKFISKMKIKKQKMDNSWLIEKYAQLKEVTPKDRTDKLMLSNLQTFNKLLNDFIKYDFQENLLITHTDLNKANFLFNGDKVVGILDFDNIEIAPRVKDIAYGIRCFCFINQKLNKAREKAFLNEYEKTNKISQAEKEMIIPFIDRDNCLRFWWFYSQMHKLPHKRYSYMKSVIELNKKINIKK